ncbi:MAG: hypothetical protein E6J00_14025 [Chloroflexi bacterium]|nr:MAG: hypothetical protein E6J00_14025 [Chloroflexota bacterium]
MINVTIASATDSTYLTVWPGGTRPQTADLNAARGQTVGNLVFAGLSGGGTAAFYNALGTPQLVLDLAGYFGPVVPAA